ncbi:hypothetical protein VITU102760_24400 [Vibrio tubiashii]|uniref:Uncharacterized protein n=1 Tax=Vibrio tubiashii ATCC 19109 TaxID=1051646 RepID=F9T5C4_9VIBR|nr:hypothetical protein [Vibrio tubiashii]AIW17476.1 hypothetical protein IX91_25815 [Vibrio tubiashii ATCC 19109]EGU55321.1 hypothetical protein VITU9109_21284 [Vibrio tubiashii ATCC 19109]EIF04398.1 hypothetical protein VT1337_08526 [Vibrio tubiashii NCIMB 1337 = ATCC 19106]
MTQQNLAKTRSNPQEETSASPLDRESSPKNDIPCSWNCLSEGVAPDWSLYDGIEMMPCTNDSPNSDETYFVSHLMSEVDADGLHVDGEEIVCWTVFGHLKTGGIDDLHDCESLKEAQELENWCESQL